MRNKGVQIVCMTMFLLSFLGGDIAVAFLSPENPVAISNFTDNSTENEKEVKYNNQISIVVSTNQSVSAQVLSDDRLGIKHPFIEIHNPPPE